MTDEAPIHTVQDISDLDNVLRVEKKYDPGTHPDMLFVMVAAEPEISIEDGIPDLRYDMVNYIRADLVSSEERQRIRALATDRVQ